MRATTLLKRLLNIDGVRMVDVDLDGLDRGGPVVVLVAPGGEDWCARTAGS